jgi:hypothetical protein
MALSPLITRNGEADVKPSPKKSKPLPVRSASIANGAATGDGPQDSGPELAEQLNEEVKMRYQKGWLDFVSERSNTDLVKIRRLEKVHMLMCIWVG